MEIKYPIILVLGLFLFVLFIVIPVIRSRRKQRVNVANTFVVKNTDVYKDIIFRYRIGIFLVFVFLFVGLMSSSLLTSRIVETSVINSKVHNRDIILCMDVSTSVADLNLKLVKSYKNIVKSLEGERFGISIFNTSSYLFVPLTEEYDFVDEKLDYLNDAFADVSQYDPEWVPMTVYNAYFKGTLIGNTERGSSLIGDGLAACVYDFPSLEDERSRIIIFSTDNDIQPSMFGAPQPYVDLETAAKISRSKDITVYSFAPSYITSQNGNSLKLATELTGGKYFVYDNKEETVKTIVKEIEKHEKGMLEGDKIYTTSDYPEIPFLFMFISFGLVIIIEKVMLS